MFDKRVFNFIKSDEDSLENKIIPKIIKSKKIIIKYTLVNMWYPMDTIKDKKIIENKFK
jgi:NDP-sugar pyrophosphorylase family protein